jgi:hypothetical protein
MIGRAFHGNKVMDTADKRKIEAIMEQRNEYGFRQLA